MGWLSILASAAVVAAEPPHTHILTPLKVRGLPSHFHGFEEFFSKFIPVVSSPFDGSNGIQILATGKVPDEKVERVANVLAEFLDNDEDGWIDNPDVVVAMARRGATMVMFADKEEIESSGFDGVPGFDVQDVNGDETSSNNTLVARLMTAQSTGHSKVCKFRPNFICDAPLEEVFHLVTSVGYAHAYPKEFGERPGTALSVSMDTLIGNCGFASASNPFGRHTFFRFPHCTGTYHYTDDTCDYGCLATEYIHHFVASYNGEYPWNARCPAGADRAHEWELCANSHDDDLSESRDLLLRGDPDGFALFTDPEFRLPLKMPNGTYTPPGTSSSGVVTTSRAFPVKVFRQISLESSLRRAHRSKRVSQQHSPQKNLVVV